MAVSKEQGGGRGSGGGMGGGVGSWEGIRWGLEGELQLRGRRTAQKTMVYYTELQRVNSSRT